MLHIACSGRHVIDRESKYVTGMGTGLKVTCYVLHIACSGRHAKRKSESNVATGMGTVPYASCYVLHIACSGRFVMYSKGRISLANTFIEGEQRKDLRPPHRE